MSIARLLSRSSWQFYKRHPAQLLLSVVGIILGVAIVTAVLITNNSSQKAFALSSEALYGRTTHQISGAQGIDQTAYVRLTTQLPQISMAPVIQGHVSIEGNVYSLIGLDPFAEAAFSRSNNNRNTVTEQTASNQADAAPSRFLKDRNALLVSDSNLADNQLSIGQEITLNAGGQTHTATIAGAIGSSNPAASRGLLMGDIAFVQELLNRGDRIDRIDLILNDNNIAQVKKSLPDNLTLDAAISRQQTMQAMTRGFHINLTAMSLLALLVGVFLIHNTMTFAVVQRREIFAIKRITGISSNTILLSILAEATIISTVGSLIGLALGYVLAHGLIQLTTQTINDLYFVLHVQEVWFNPWLIVAGLVLGVGSSVVAASLSAIDAAATNPIQARQRSVIEQRANSLLPLFALLGLGLIVVGLALAYFPSQSLVLGFIALMMLILGYGLTLPWLIKRLSALCRPLVAPFGASAAFALGGIERNISRTGLAIAALCIAVSATFGVDIMIGSFRSSVDQWLGATLQSNIYISAPSIASSQNTTKLSPTLLQQVKNTDGISSVSTGLSIAVSSSVGNMEMQIIQPHKSTTNTAGFELIYGDESTAWNDWTTSAVVMISEPLATKSGLNVGDAISVLTESRGKQTFFINAVFRDYESSHGKILMSRTTYSQFWPDEHVTNLGIMLISPELEDSIMNTLKSTLVSTDTPLIIQSNSAIHRESLRIFDRTFEVTRVLRWLTVGVAFVGIFSALLALHLERAREFAILRATGATRQAIASIVITQTLIMGVLAGLLALPLGWLMSELLINVINVRSFGWSMQSLIPGGAILSTLFLATSSALLAGLYPAYRLSQSNIANQLRDE